MEIRGINVKTNKADEIFVGLHVDTFIKTLQSAPVNPSGWVTVILFPLRQHVKGYSHKPVLQEVEHKAS